MDSTHSQFQCVNVILQSSDLMVRGYWKMQFCNCGFSLLQDCWRHVNAKKGFLPKLWALLKEGGKGMAKALHPNLMPLLSKLPQEITHPSLDFYSTFFTSFIQGWVACLRFTVIIYFMFCRDWLKFFLLVMSFSNDNLGYFCVSVCPVSEPHPAHQRVQSSLLLWLSVWGTA